MLVGQYFTKHYRGHFYPKARESESQTARRLRSALNDYDLLLMPTLPMKATPIRHPCAARLYIQRAFEMVPIPRRSTHRVIRRWAFPCGMSDGLPIGLMLIGKIL